LFKILFFENTFVPSSLIVNFNHATLCVSMRKQSYRQVSVCQSVSALYPNS